MYRSFTPASQRRFKMACLSIRSIKVNYYFNYEDGYDKSAVCALQSRVKNTGTLQ